MTFLVNNVEHFNFNFTVHNIITSRKQQLQSVVDNLPPLKKKKKSLYYATTVIFNTKQIALRS